MRHWYEFKADASKNQTEVFIYDSIGGFGISASTFIAHLQTVPAAHRLVVRIHSPGGSVLDGNAIFNALKAHPGGVTTQIDGLAASMASVIAIAGKPARMAENGLLMIHNVSGWAEGDAEEMRQMADLTEKVQETIVQAYIDRTGISRRKIMKMMDDETWLDAAEAKELGFVDEIGAPLKMAASFDLSRFRNAPSFDTHRAANMATVPELTITPEQKGFLQQLAAFFKQPAPVTDETGPTLEALEADLVLAIEAFDGATADLAAVTVERDALTAQLAALTATIEKPEVIEARVAMQVAQRLADAGIDPIRRDTPAPEGDLSAELAAITDPMERTRFYRANKAAIDASFSK